MEARTAGFGLAGMRERVSLAGGTLRIASDEQGTSVQAILPVPGAVESPRLARAQT